jgi:hypothetical protein
VLDNLSGRHKSIFPLLYVIPAGVYDKVKSKAISVTGLGGL